MGKRKMNLRAAVVGFNAVAILLAGCATQSCALCGRWRSNAQRTLVEMEASHVLSEKQRQFFRRDFYGRLIVETREGASRAYFAEESPDGVPWEPWHVVSRSGNTLQVQLVMAGKVVVRSIALDGDCYRVDQSSLAFGEWFCRAP